MGLLLRLSVTGRRAAFSSYRNMSSSAAPLLLSAKQAFDLQKSAGSSVSILDATWFMPNSPRKSKQEFIEKRLPGAQFLDLDEVASPNELGLKHMMPDSQTFARACGA